jgi:hypothetical protein
MGELTVLVGVLLGLASWLAIFALLCGIFVRLGRAADSLAALNRQIAAIGNFIADQNSAPKHDRNGDPIS